MHHPQCRARVRGVAQGRGLDLPSAFLDLGVSLRSRSWRRKASSSALDSDSVGSIISVPGTGKLRWRWKP